MSGIRLNGRLEIWNQSNLDCVLDNRNSPICHALRLLSIPVQQPHNNIDYPHIHVNIHSSRTYYSSTLSNNQN